MIAPPEPLSLRPAVIGGETAPDDFEVIWDDLSVGRIRRTAAVGGENWSWGVILAHKPQYDWMRGGAATLEDCKARFRDAWSSVHGGLTEAEVGQIRDEERSNIERPWNRRR